MSNLDFWTRKKKHLCQKVIKTLRNPHCYPLVSHLLFSDPEFICLTPTALGLWRLRSTVREFHPLFGSISSRFRIFYLKNCTDVIIPNCFKNSGGMARLLMQGFFSKLNLHIVQVELLNQLMFVKRPNFVALKSGCVLGWDAQVQQIPAIMFSAFR